MTAASPRRRLEFVEAATVDAEVIECEAAVFGHYFGNTAAELAEAYDPYREQAAFLVVRAGDAVVGVSRLIRAGRLALKTVADLALPPWEVDAARSAAAAGIDLARTWDVATLAVRPESGWAARMVASALFHGMVQASQVNGVDWMTAILDRRARSLMAAQGLDVHAFPGATAAPYFGSAASTPVYAHMARLLAQQRRVNPEGYRTLASGWGLDDFVLPRREQYRLPVPPIDLRASVRVAGPRQADHHLPSEPGRDLVGGHRPGEVESL